MGYMIFLVSVMNAPDCIERNTYVGPWSMRRIVCGVAVVPLRPSKGASRHPEDIRLIHVKLAGISESVTLNKNESEEAVRDILRCKSGDGPM